jgi:hypothetical protein
MAEGVKVEKVRHRAINAAVNHIPSAPPMTKPKPKPSVAFRPWTSHQERPRPRPGKDDQKHSFRQASGREQAIGHASIPHHDHIEEGSTSMRAPGPARGIRTHRAADSSTPDRHEAKRRTIQPNLCGVMFPSPVRGDALESPPPGGGRNCERDSRAISGGGTRWSSPPPECLALKPSAFRPPRRGR